MEEKTKLSIMGDEFEQLRADADNIIQRLIGNMISKGSLEGEMTIKVAVKFLEKSVETPDGNWRMAMKPSLEHKISSTLKIQDQKSGAYLDEMKEVVWDPDTKQYIVRYIEGAEQMNLFEYNKSQNQKSDEPDPEVKPEENEPKMIEGPVVLGLPVSDTDSEAEESIIDADFREVDEEHTAEPENVEESESEASVSEDSGEKQPEEADPYQNEYDQFEKEVFDGYPYEDPNQDPVDDGVRYF